MPTLTELEEMRKKRIAKGGTFTNEDLTTYTPTQATSQIAANPPAADNSVVKSLLEKQAIKEDRIARGWEDAPGSVAMSRGKALLEEAAQGAKSGALKRSQRQTLEASGQNLISAGTQEANAASAERTNLTTLAEMEQRNNQFNAKLPLEAQDVTTRASEALSQASYRKGSLDIEKEKLVKIENTNKIAIRKGKQAAFDAYNKDIQAEKKRFGDADISQEVYNERLKDIFAMHEANLEEAGWVFSSSETGKKKDLSKYDR